MSDETVYVAAPVQFCVGIDPQGMPVHQAAIVTAIMDVQQQVVALTILSPTGMQIVHGVPHDATGKRPGSWCWPQKASPVLRAVTMPPGAIGRIGA